MKFKTDTGAVELSMDNKACKLTKGLQTTLFLNGLGFWNLQPKFAYMFGGAEAFCRAWAHFMRIDFDGDVEAFYKRFDFEIIEKAEELTKLIRELVNRDIEPVKEMKADEASKPKTKRGKRS